MPLSTADRIAIQDVLVRYTHALDYGDIDRMPELWTPDCHFQADQPELDLRGIDELIGFFRRTVSTLPDVRHVVSNIYAEAAGSKRAIQRAYLQIVDFRNQKLIAGGRYQDELVKTPQGWRIEKRRFIAG